MSNNIVDNTLEFLNSLTETERYELDLQHLRFQRNNLLEKSDIYMYQIDRFTPEQIEELKVYRQALRDLTNNKDNVKNFNIPIKPSFINN